VLAASEAEAALHEQYLDRMEKGAKEPPVWRRILKAS
jgi:hypothetical protein